jgi:hypothetical protein
VNKPDTWYLKRMVSGSVLVAALFAAICFVWNTLGDRREAELTNAYVQEIISNLDLASVADFHERVENIRIFINDNSVFSVDDTFWKNKARPSSFAAGLLAHSKGTASNPVHMECSTRTSLMSNILRTLGYETRVVAIFNSNENLSSHSFLEVMNPETGRWETQDAQLDVYWRSKGSGERVSLADAAEDLDAVEPCGRSRCGWDLENREGSKVKRMRQFLDIISLTQKDRDLRYALYTSRANLNRIYTKDGKRGTFCEVRAKHCRQGFYDIRKFSSYAPGLPR